MICANCNTANDPNNIYCNSCGHPIANNPTFSAHPTIPYRQLPPTISVVDQPYSSVVTPFVGQSTAPPKKHGLIGVLIALIGLLVIGVIAAVGLFIAMNYGGESEKLPDRLGMFVQSDAKDRVDEIRRQDFANATEARNNLMKGDLSFVTSRPNLIIYADGRDMPVNDMRLVQLDTIKDDGTMKTLDFQVAPVDGKPEMKRIRVPDAIASGRYAFALFDGYFNEGKHKFWAFQVSDSSRTSNDDLLKAASVSLKPKTSAPPAATKTAAPPANVSSAVPPPDGGTAATVKTRIKLRSGPTQFAKNQIGSLNPGTRVYILDYSTTVETYNGVTSRYAYVQTEGGKRGWAFAAFLQ
jgi:hypothetical protein